MNTNKLIYDPIQDLMVVNRQFLTERDKEIIRLHIKKHPDYIRITKILVAIPKIKNILQSGGTWDDIKYLCDPLDLTDTAFREQPIVSDYLLNVKYWKTRLKELKNSYN